MYRGKFFVFTVSMAYLSSNIPSPIFYDLIFSELLRIAPCALRLTELVCKASQLYNRMITQGVNKVSTLCHKK